MSVTTHQHDPANIQTLIAGLLSGRPDAAADRIERHGLWEYVAAEAWQSRIGGVLIRHLQRQGIAVPPSARSQLESYRAHIRAANAYKLARIEPVLARLQASGIPFMLLKGAALNAVLYPEHDMRPMIDIDVIIRPRDAQHADRVLTDFGCMPGAELVQPDFYPRYHYEREYFTRNRPPVKIDLHARPFRPLRYARTVPDGALWDRAQTVSFGDLRVAIPSTENMLIHLAVHAACHGLGEFRWLYDIKSWLDRFGTRIDWPELADRCRRWRLTLPVRRALETVQDTFDPAEPVIQRALGHLGAAASALDRLALRQAPRGESHPTADVLANLFCSPGIRFRLGYLRAVLVPAPAHLSQIYPRRHPGWRLVAHALRAARGLARPLMKPAAECA